MNSRRMRDFEEFEGLSSVAIDVPDLEDLTIQEDDTIGNSGIGAALNAKLLSMSELIEELDKRGMATSGFPDDLRDALQAAFDKEFASAVEDSRQRHRERQRKVAQQRGLQERRMLMEAALQEEQEVLASNHQARMMIALVRENLVGRSLRLAVDSVTARTLAKAMWVNDTLTALDLSGNGLSDHAGTYLARILLRNTTLKKLDLDSNHLGPRTASAFGESLTVNTSLTYLCLDSNPLTISSSHTAPSTSHGNTFASSTTTNTTSSGTGTVGSDLSGITALCTAIRQNTTLTSLSLWRTGLTVEAGGLVCSAICASETLLLCDIGGNEIKIGDLKRITDQLDNNLTRFEKNERQRRAALKASEEEAKNIALKKEKEQNAIEVNEWLHQQREERSSERRAAEEARILKLQEELAERRRKIEMQKEEERRALAEAAAKKAKKAKDKGKNGKKK